MLNRFIRFWVSYNQNHSGYRLFKKRIAAILSDEHVHGRSLYNSIMIILVLSSVIIMAFDISMGLGAWVWYFELFIISIFAVEYLCRLWTVSDLHRIGISEFEKVDINQKSPSIKKIAKHFLTPKWNYIKSPLGIIDLLVIFPLYHPLRLLRLLLLLRLFKLFHYSRVFYIFSLVLQDKKFELRTIFLMLFIVIIFSSSFLYVFESKLADSSIKTFFDAFYWSVVTLSTVGYGDLTPITPEGKIITMVLILSGVGLVAFFTSTLVSAFNNNREVLYHSRVISEIHNCKHYTLMFGFGSIAETLIKHYRDDLSKIIVIDNSKPRVEVAKSMSLIAQQGDITDYESIAPLINSSKLNQVLCLTSNDVANTYLTLSLRHQCPGVRILVRANETENIQKMYQAGADSVINLNRSIAHLGKEFVAGQASFDALQALLYGARHSKFELIHLGQTSPLIGYSIKQFKALDKKPVLLGLLRSLTSDSKTNYVVGDFTFMFNPNDDCLLKQDDQLVFIGARTDLDDLLAQYGRSQ